MDFYWLLTPVSLGDRDLYEVLLKSYDDQSDVFQKTQLTGFPSVNCKVQQKIYQRQCFNVLPNEQSRGSKHVMCDQQSRQPSMQQTRKLAMRHPEIMKKFTLMKQHKVIPMVMTKTASIMEQGFVGLSSCETYGCFLRMSLRLRECVYEPHTSPQSNFLSFSKSQNSYVFLLGVSCSIRQFFGPFTCVYSGISIFNQLTMINNHHKTDKCHIKLFFPIKLPSIYNFSVQTFDIPIFGFLFQSSQIPLYSTTDVCFLAGWADAVDFMHQFINHNKQQILPLFIFYMPSPDKEIEILKYETGKHHRQNLRANIDQNMIDSIEISHNPSGNYQKAFKGLYHDELEKSVSLHVNKKNIENTKKDYNRQINVAHSGIYNHAANTPLKPGLGLNSSISALQLKNLNYRDVDYHDYDLLKETRALQHTFKNYDGGQKFYQSHDMHLGNQKALQENMRLTLQRQMHSKNQQKQSQNDKKVHQTIAMREREFLHKQYDRIDKQNQKNRNKEHCEIIKQQMQEQRIRRGRKSLFNYDSMTRHNPITNPIEYHIDNPYILKQIQNKSRHSLI